MTFDERIALDNVAYYSHLPEVPPAMTGADVPLYRTWKMKPFPTPQQVVFNVRVGPPLEDLSGETTQDALLAAQLLALRIDALVFDGNAWWVVEFHYSAGLPQFGRLIAYPELLRATYHADPPLKTLMICETANPFLIPLFTAYGIPILRYPEPGAEGTFLNPGTA